MASNAVAYLMWVTNLNSYIMLDDYYTDENNGVFNLETPYDHITALRFIGYNNVVAIVFDDESIGNNGEALYYFMEWDDNTYFSYYVDSSTKKPVIVCFFRL